MATPIAPPTKRRSKGYPNRGLSLLSIVVYHTLTGTICFSILKHLMLFRPRMKHERLWCLFLRILEVFQWDFISAKCGWSSTIILRHAIQPGFPQLQAIQPAPPPNLRQEASLPPKWLFVARLKKTMNIVSSPRTKAKNKEVSGQPYTIYLYSMLVEYLWNRETEGKRPSTVSEPPPFH